MWAQYRYGSCPGLLWVLKGAQYITRLVLSGGTRVFYAVLRKCFIPEGVHRNIKHVYNYIARVVRSICILGNQLGYMYGT